jgi:hypothetical protein
VRLIRYRGSLPASAKSRLSTGDGGATERIVFPPHWRNPLRVFLLCYCDDMRNITVAVDDETYTRARVAAAERDTSVSALVKAYLEQLASQETETERQKRQEREIRSRIESFRASDRLSREGLHDRSRSR